MMFQEILNHGWKYFLYDIDQQSQWSPQTTACAQKEQHNSSRIFAFEDHVDKGNNLVFIASRKLDTYNCPK